MNTSKWIGIASIALFSLAGCHRGPTALSADGDTLKEGQTVYVKASSLACYSEDEWNEAQQMVKGGGMPALMEYSKGGAHCAVISTGSSVKILTVEQDDGDQLVVVKDLNDPSAPSQVWIESKRLTVNQP